MPKFNKARVSMKAIWNNQVVAESRKDSLVLIEGQWYLPAESLKQQYFRPTSKKAVYFWKGLASYPAIGVDGQFNDAGAWYYPKPTMWFKKIIKNALLTTSFFGEA